MCQPDVSYRIGGYFGRSSRSCACAHCGERDSKSPVDWRLATRDWRLATGDWRLATGDSLRLQA